MEEAREMITVMVHQESKYRCHNYMMSPISSSCCTSQRALHLLEECAMVVTDFSHCSNGSMIKDAPHKSTVNKVPSVVSVQDFGRSGSSISSDSSSSHDSSHRCQSCQKPLQQQQFDQLYPPYPSEDSLQFWREQMFDWSCMVVDSYGITDRSTVIANSFSILDRYVAYELASDEVVVPITREDFQLFSMTCLYIAIKIMEGHKLTIDALVMMSRGFYKAQDIIATEHEILKALQWKLHAPTAISFCRLMWELMPVDQQQPRQGRRWADLEPSCAMLTEMAVSDASFVGCKASTVALASLVLSARLRGFAESSIQQLLQNVEGFVDVSGTDSEFQQVYRQLESIY